jgi:hypothetical protein
MRATSVRRNPWADNKTSMGSAGGLGAVLEAMGGVIGIKNNATKLQKSKNATKLR